MNKTEGLLYMCLQLSVPDRSTPGWGRDHLSKPVPGDVDAPAGLCHHPAAMSPAERRLPGPVEGGRGEAVSPPEFGALGTAERGEDGVGGQ